MGLQLKIIQFQIFNAQPIYIDDKAAMFTNTNDENDAF